jgi:ribosomal protein S18 acetylase RimI-like enzyme
VNALSIRPFEPSDRAAVIDLWTRCGLTIPQNDPDQDIDLAAGRGNSDILIGALLGRVAATVMVGHDGHRGWLYYVAVDPAHQGQGLGRAMVAAAEDWIGARGVPKAQLMVRDTNDQAVGFYAALGYAVIPRIVMQKVLQPLEG